HTLSASCFIAGFSIPFSETQIYMWEIQVFTLLLIGVILFVHGLVVYK
ncbi:MAG: hypothetical protein RLZZ619_1359, partial [Pseudomonadota bacterium]